MKDFTIGLKQNIEHAISYPGSSFHIQEATDKVTLRFNNGDSITREKTQGGTVPKFDRVILESKVDQVVTVTIGDGQTIDGRAQVVSATVNTTIEPSNSNTDAGDVTIPAGSTVQVIGSNVNRKKLQIFAGENNIQNLRVGGPLTDATHGAILAPGGNGMLETEAAVYVFNPGAASEKVTLLEMERI